MPYSVNLKADEFGKFFFLFFSGWGFLALLAAWGGFFCGWIFIIYAIGSLSILLRTSRFTFQGVFRHLQSSLFLLFAFCFLLSCFLALFFQPATFFSGRDEGSISQAALYLAQDHSLTHKSPEATALFQIYGEGKALNFPGFYYTHDGSLTPQFPTGYIAWLASYISLFGIFGLPIANALLLFLFFLTFSSILKQFVSPLWIYIGILLAATSFPIFWFARFTLSENFALAFLWIFLWALLRCTARPSNTLLALLFLSGTLLLFGRIEGIVFVALGVGTLFMSRKTRTFLTRQSVPRLIIPFIGVCILLATSFDALRPFYVTVAKAVLQGSGDGSAPYLSQQSDRLILFALYGIAAEIALGLIGIIAFAQRGKKHLPKLIPFIITFPTFLYLFLPFISNDHPWMLRRYMFALLPVCLYFSVLLLARIETLRSSRIAVAITSLLFLFHVGAFAHFFPIIQGKNLLQGTLSIAQSTQTNDLLLIDRASSGDGWHMLPGPLRDLFHRHALYFFNPQDFAHLNTQKFDRVLLIVPHGQEDFYGNLLTNKSPFQTFTLTQDLLESPVPLNQKKFPKLLNTERVIDIYEIK